MITRSARSWLLLLPAALLAVGCGSDDDDSTDTTAAQAPTTAAQAPTTAAATTVAATTPEATTGETTAGTGAAATGEPLVIGVANMDTGSVAFPGAGQTALVAEQYINEELGGIQGRPLQIETCDMKNDEQASQACGQQFANNDEMPMAILTLAVNAGPFYAAMNAAGKPLLGGYGITPADNAPENTYFYYSGATFYYALADWIEEQGGIKTIAYFHQPDPASQGGADTLKSIVPDDVEINEQIVPVGAADLTPQVTASGAEDADLVIAFASPCGPLAQAFGDLGITPKQVISLTSCVNVDELKASPELYAGWIIANPSKVPSADPDDNDSKLLLEMWEKYGPGDPIGPFAELGWGTVMTLRQVLEDLPADQLTSEGIGAALAAYGGPVVMGAETISCPGADPTPATCANGLVFYDVTAEGDLATSG